MARPRRISDESILDAAREVFLEQGYSAPTSEVARRSGCSEGTIFKRFPTKAALFCACMVPGELPASVKLAEQGLPIGEPREAMRQMFTGFVGFFRELLPRVLMLWSSRAIDHPFQIHEGQENPAPKRLIAALAGFLEGERKAGRIRCVDTQVAARALIGAAQNYALFEMMGMHDDSVPDEDEYGRRVVDLLWRGLDPEVTR
jgi:AcrR family transcriptional regulator